MKKYRCKICGYIYDEEKEGVKFEDLSEDWKCPMCGAPKSLFEEIKEEKQEINIEINENIDNKDLRELSNYEISLICSNLSKACEKQYLEEEYKLFKQLKEYYENKEKSINGNLNDISNLIKEDINMLNNTMNIVDKYNDRGAKRVITWALKTSNIIKYIIENYEKEGLEYIKNTKIWVCDICGFVYIGDEKPDVCPVCRVPSLKILEVK